MNKCFENLNIELPVFFSDENIAFSPNKNTDFIKERLTAITSRKPVFFECESKKPFVDDDRIKAIIYEGEPCGGKPAKVFAYIGFPEGASAENPVPGMLLVHGGAGHAYAEWVKMWVDRGYAAIAFDGFGQLPADGEYRGDDGWALNPESHPTMDEFASFEKPIDEHFFYYYLTDAEIAFEILRSDKRVIKEKIGLTGISWGSYIATELVCYDDRFLFAVPVYGSAFQHESTGIFGNFTAKVKEVWEPSLLIKKVKTPVLFINTDSDIFFSANTMTKSAAALKNGAVCYINGLLHSQQHGSSIPEIFRFADSFMRGGEGNIEIKGIKLCRNEAAVSLYIPADVTDIKLRLYYRKSGLQYSKDAAVMYEILEKWSFSEGEYKDGAFKVLIPDEANIFYFAVMGADREGNTVHGTSGLFYADKLPAQI